MSDARAAASGEQAAAENASDRPVGTLELFFDLVFVYAMAQVTILMLADISWAGFGHGLLALAAVWWAWTCYAWLTNTSDHAGPVHRLLIFLAMAAMLVAAVALPQAFGERALVFGLAFLAVRLIHVALLALAVRGDADVGAPALRLIPSLLTGPALLVVAAFVETPGRELLWIAAAVVDHAGPMLVGTAGWGVAPAYFVERHGQIIIIALAEAIVEVGAGAEDSVRRPGVVIAILLAVLIAAGLWWSYFGYLRGGAERRLRGTGARERARLARDSYSYLHLPMVAGVVFFALGVHEAVAGAAEPLPLFARRRPGRWCRAVLRRRRRLPMARSPPAGRRPRPCRRGCCRADPHCHLRAGLDGARRTHARLSAPDELGTMATPRDRAGRQPLTVQHLYRPLSSSTSRMPSTAVGCDRWRLRRFWHLIGECLRSDLPAAYERRILMWLPHPVIEHQRRTWSREAS